MPHPSQLHREECDVDSQESHTSTSTYNPLTLWSLFGLSAGLGLLNKPSMAFFLAALAAALLLTAPGRRLLLRRESLAAIALLLALAAPNLLWQAHHGWPTLEFLRNGRVEGKNLTLPPLAFLNAQVQALNPLAIFLWLPGLVWLLRRSPWRWLGLTYLLFLAAMFSLHAKDYYVSPIYPVLFAAGGIAWEGRRWRPFGRFSAAPSPDRANRLIAFPLYSATLLLSGLLILPMAIPVLRPGPWLRYVHTLHLAESVTHSESSPTGPLPQFYADRFGWQEEADKVSAIVASLSPDDRSRLTIVCSNYGEAGALQLLAPTLPFVASPHNNYWLWGPGPGSGEVALILSGDTPDHLHQLYNTVDTVGTLDVSPFQMPFERHHRIFLVRHRREDLRSAWSSLKHFI